MVSFMFFFHTKAYFSVLAQGLHIIWIGAGLTPLCMFTFFFSFFFVINKSLNIAQLDLYLDPCYILISKH